MKRGLYKLRVNYRKIFRPSKVVLHGKKVIVDKRKFSHVIIKTLYRERYEQSEIRSVRRALDPDDRVLEIGSGMGLVSMIVADLVGDHNILCFEADPEMVEIARRNFSLNKHNIEIRHGLVSSGNVPHSATKKFNVHSDFWSSSSHREQGSVRTIDVPSNNLDALLESFCPTVLLMDIEGDEVELLMGVTGFGPIRKIIMETHYRFAGRNETDRMIRHLYSMGFDIDLQLSGSDQVVLNRE